MNEREMLAHEIELEEMKKYVLEELKAGTFKETYNDLLDWAQAQIKELIEIGELNASILNF